MPNPNALSPKIDTTVVIVSGQASAAGFSSPLFVSEFVASPSFPTRIKAYSGTRTQILALLAADGFATTSAAYRQAQAALAQDGPPSTIYIGRKDAGDADWTAAMDAIYAEDSDSWYAVCIDARDSAAIQQVSAWCEPPGEDPKFALFIAQTASAQVRDNAPGNFASVIAAAGRQRTALVWHDPETASGYGPATLTSRRGPFAFGSSESLSLRVDGGSTQSFAFSAAAAVLTGSNTETFDLSAGGSLVLAANGLASQSVDFTSTAATVLSANTQTYNLAPGDTLAMRVDGGAIQTATFDAGPAVTTGGATEPFSITNGWKLDLQINGGATQSFTFDGSETTADDVADLINATAIGFSAADDGSGAVELTTDRLGTSAEIEILNTSTGSLLTELGLSAGSDTGTGDVADIDAVTAAEIVTVVNADTTGITATAPSGAVRLTSDTLGTSSRIQVTGGNVNTALGFPTSEAKGTGPFVDASVATASEVASLINANAAGLTASVSTGAVRLTSDVLGTGSSVTITAGTVATTLGLASGTVTGTGDFADASAATASEIAIKIGATLTDASVDAVSSAVVITSDTSGAASSLEIVTDSVGLTWSGDGAATGTGTDEDYLDCALVGRCITFNLDAPNGAALWDNQSLTGISPDVLTVAQKASLEQRRVNAYYALDGRGELHWGTILRLDDADYVLYIDELTTADWIDARMTEALNSLLNNYSNRKAKIPYTDDGFALVENVFRDVLKRAERNGHTVYDGSPLNVTDPEDTGVYIPRLANQSQADINARRYSGMIARQNFQGGVQRVNSRIELQRPPVQL